MALNAGRHTIPVSLPSLKHQLQDERKHEGNPIYAKIALESGFTAEDLARQQAEALAKPRPLQDSKLTRAIS